MLTVIESALFSRLWPEYWSPEEYGDFILHLALDPEAGDVIAGSGGCRRFGGPGRVWVSAAALGSSTH